MTLSKLLDEIETSVTPTATLVGSVLVVLVVLGLATTAIIVIGKWSPLAGRALSVLVLFGTILTVIELIVAFGLRSEANVTVSASSIRRLLCIKAVELSLFACALVVLYVFLF